MGIRIKQIDIRGKRKRKFVTILEKNIEHMLEMYEQMVIIQKEKKLNN